MTHPLPKNEPEVDNIDRLRIEDILRRLRDAGLPTDSIGALGPDLVAELRAMPVEDQIVTAVATSIFGLIRLGIGTKPEEVIEEICRLIEICTATGGVMAIEQVIRAADAATEVAIKENGPPPNELARISFDYYALLKSLEIGYATIQGRRNSLRTKQFKHHADAMIARKQKEPKV